MARYPVEQDADTCAVAAIDQIAQVIATAETCAGCEITRDLITPGFVEWMFHHRQELDVGVTEIGHIGHQLVGQVAGQLGAAHGLPERVAGAFWYALVPPGVEDEHPGRVDTCLRREQKRLADRLDGQGNDDLIGRFAGLASAMNATGTVKFKN